MVIMTKITMLIKVHLSGVLQGKIWFIYDDDDGLHSELLKMIAV